MSHYRIARVQGRLLGPLLLLCYFLASSIEIATASPIGPVTASPNSGNRTIQAFEPELKQLAQANDWLGVERVSRQALRTLQDASASGVDVAAANYWLATALAKLGRNTDAEPLYQRSLEILEKTLGPDDPAVEQSVRKLGEFYRAQGLYAKAEPLYQRVLASRERVLDPEDPEVAVSLNNLAAIYYAEGQYAKAEPLYQRALAIKEKALGPDRIEIATSLNNLAALYRTWGQYSKAEPLYQRSIDIREKVLGPDNPAVATSLNNLALLYENLGQYSKAEPLYKRSLAIKEKGLGPGHPDVATALNNLAELYVAEGQYAEAETPYQRSVAILETALGPNHPDVATSLNNLGSLYQTRGQYAKAEPLIQRALAIREAALGPGHPDVATSLSNLGDLYANQGQLARAELVYQRSLEIQAKTLGAEHPRIAKGLSSLAWIHQLRHQYAQAEQLYLHALAMQEKAFGPDNLDVSTSLHGLARLYAENARYAQAEALYKRSLSIEEKALGPTHPDIARDLRGLAEAYDKEGLHAQAEQLYQRSIAISEKALGTQDPELAATRADLGIDYALQNRFDLATANLRRACGALDPKRHANVGEGNMADAMRSATTCSNFYSLSLWGWSAQGGAAGSSDRPEALKLEAFIAGQLAVQSAAGDAMARSAAFTAANSADVGSEARDYEAALLERANLDRRFAAVASETDQSRIAKFAALSRARDAVVSRIDQHEAVLKAKAPLYWDYRAPEPITVAALQAKAGAEAVLLREEEALIVLLSPSGADKGLAFAVTKERVAWARLSLTGDEIKARVAKLRAQIDPEGYGVADTPSARVVSYGPFDRQASYELYQALLGDPAIQAVLQDKSVLLFVPSGALTSLPPGLLVTTPPAGGRRGDTDPATLRATAWLLRTKAVAMLPAVSSLRTLRQFETTSPSAATDPLLAFADPAFRRSTVPQPNRVARGVTRGYATYTSDGVPLAEALDRLPSLPGTRIEGEALRRALEAGPASLLTGRDASKAQLMARNKDGRLLQVRVLEFATHGLVAGDASDLAEPALVLAAGEKPADELLLASEASTLKLNADWVLLSACNTASPDAPEAQGLSGLSRAFFYAGAHSLLVSHWTVRDDVAPKLIPATLLAERANPSISRAQALRQASLAILDDETIDATAPSAWASFTLIGEAGR